MMGLRLYDAGWFTASIYDPLILHYGGGCYWTIHGSETSHKIFSESSAKAGDDAANFRAYYGDSELERLHAKWQAEFDARSDVPTLNF